jgi:nucleoside-diphosphate-sugar epimerase
MRIAVTGAYGFSGKYMARRLLELRHEVITLTNSPHRSNPFGESISVSLQLLRAKGAQKIALVISPLRIMA